MAIILNNLRFEKAKEKDWNEILGLLEETNLIDRISGNGNHENFYTVKAQGKLVCCFAIFHKNNIGILKSFGIRKEYQGQGIGKIIANQLPDLIKTIGINRLYAASWEAPGFWRKTNFKEVNPKESKDTFFLIYVNYLEKNFPQFSRNRKHFVLIS